MSAQDRATGRRQMWWKKNEVGAHLHTVRRAAQEGGLSLHRMRQALYVAIVPDEQFEVLLESDNPPTVEQLANLGRRRHAEWGPALAPARGLCPHRGGTANIRPSAGLALVAWLTKLKQGPRRVCVNTPGA